MKTILTYDEHLRLVALFALAKEHLNWVQRCERALTRMLRVAPREESEERFIRKRVSDEIYDQHSDGEDFMRRFGITVEGAQTEERHEEDADDVD